MELLNDLKNLICDFFGLGDYILFFSGAAEYHIKRGGYLGVNHRKDLEG